MKRGRLNKLVVFAVVLCVMAGEAALLWLLSRYHWFLAKDLLVICQYVLQLLALVWFCVRLNARKAEAQRVMRRQQEPL